MPDSAGDWSETRLLDAFREWLGEAMPPPPAGMGDDAAVLPDRIQNVVTVDPVIANRHFRWSDDPAAVGHKLALRNASDLAAMGAQPGGAVLSLAMPSTVALPWLEAFLRGLGEAALRYGFVIHGGDLAQTEADFVATLTAWGHTVRPLLRTGARPGDVLAVTGELGGSSEGKHLTGTPRLREGQWLARHEACRSLIDVSDGLAKDLPALLGPHRANLDLAAIPIAPAAFRLAANTGRVPLDHALTDGEDYELLMCVSADAWDDLAAAWQRDLDTPLTRIGVIAPAPADLAGLLFDAQTGARITGTGYEHFGRA